MKHVEVQTLRIERLRNAISLGNLKEKIREIREKNLEKIEDLVEEAMENFERNGVEVYLAKNSEEARKIAEKIAGRVIVKSKTNVGEEVGIKEYLREKGKEVVETDCGAFLVDLLKKQGVHPIEPALGLKLDEIAKALGCRPVEEEIKEKVRAILNEKFERADTGICGANFFSADGSIFLVENEGNIAKVLTRENLIVITSIEKVVKSREEGLIACLAQSEFSTARIAKYIHIVSGPSGTGDLGKYLKGMHGAREMHIIVVDNGRSELLQSDLKEILKCINCGLCVLACPLFPNVGFEHRGIRGVILQSKKKSKEEISREIWKCTGCELCYEVCPVGINLHDLVIKMREKIAKEGMQTEANKRMLELIARYGNTVGKRGKIPELVYCC